MMSIGEFAAMTGLTVRALRFYDEQGVLVPAAVDELSRYRRYSAEQLAPAVELGVLRRAGIPLAEAARVLDGEVDAGKVVAAYRERLQEEHARQFRKLDELEMLLTVEAERRDGLDAVSAVTVEERQAEQCHWAGVALVFDEEVIARAAVDGAAAFEDDRDDPNEAVPRALNAVGNPPVGPPWMSIRIRDETAAELLTCWPVAEPVPDDWSVPGWPVVRGEVHVGPELVAYGPFDGVSIFERMLQLPGVVAILREAERRGVDVDLGRVRQTMPDHSYDGGDVDRFEVAVPLRRR